MKRLNCTQDKANATIWEHCLEMFHTMREAGPRIGHDVTEAVATVCGLTGLLLTLVTLPVSFPIIAYFIRRSARKEVADWEARRRAANPEDQESHW